MPGVCVPDQEQLITKVCALVVTDPIVGPAVTAGVVAVAAVKMLLTHPALSPLWSAQP